MAENFDTAKNLRYYAYARSVPKEAQKDFNNGSFSGTDINPMWRIRMLTEMFGPAGVGWYTEVLSERQEQLTEDTTISIVDLNLYVNVDGQWSKPIFGTGGNTLKTKTSKGYIKTTDEGYKMAYTDALGVACKALGIGAEIYWARDKTKYDNYFDNEENPDATPAKAAELRKQASAPKPATTPEPKAEPQPDPKPLTAVLEFKKDPEEVTPELLNELAKHIRAAHPRDSKWESEEFVPTYKALNNNKPNYRAAPDEPTRRAIYNALYTKFIEEA
jgi:hypothetical protein